VEINDGIGTIVEEMANQVIEVSLTFHSSCFITAYLAASLMSISQI
jgi:hypothetical protein